MHFSRLKINRTDSDSDCIQDKEKSKIEIRIGEIKADGKEYVLK